MIGETLSHYEIRELAGGGGMGRVYRAWDRRLDRTVALKLLHPERQADPHRRRRLLREARACSRLSHPGIVSVHDIGRDRGLDFIVMEWVRGRTLDELIPEGGLPASEAVSYALQLADALAAAHGAGVIHRDLKPRNVMVGEGGRVKLLDLGVARVEPVLDQETLAGDSTDLTDDGVSPGTLAYMAPEQALGEPVDARSDVFGLGLLLYEMLTGSRPFRGGGLAAQVRQLVLADPPPLVGVKPDLDPALEELVDRALAKRPEDRFQDMTSLASALRGLEVGAGEGRAPGGAPRRRRKPRRSVVVPALLALGLVVAASHDRLGELGLGVTPGTIEAASRAGLGGEGDQAPGGELRTPYELYSEGSRLLERYDRKGNIERAIGRFEEAIRLDETYAPAHSGLARAYWREYRLLRDPVWLDRAFASARRALDLDPHLTHARVSFARVRISRGEVREARGELETLRRLDPDDTDVLAALAEVATVEGRRQDAVELYQAAIRLRPKDWWLQSELGIAWSRLGEIGAAEAAFEKSIELVPDNAYARRNLGGIYFFQGRYGEAISELQESISIRPTGVAYSNLGTIYYFQGYYREAASAFEAARRLGANGYQLWANLGDAYRQIPGREEEAELSLRRAVQLLGRDLTTTPDDMEAKSRMALLLAKLGYTERSLEEIAGVEPLQQRSAATIYRVAFAYELGGRRDLALDALELALERGYPPEEVRKEPELTRLREDVAYHRMMTRFDPQPPG